MTGPAVAQVNLDILKTLRQVIAAAENGQVASIMLVGCDPVGNVIQAVLVQDHHVEKVNTAIDCMKAKLVASMIAREKQRHVSPIVPAKTMPDG